MIEYDGLLLFESVPSTNTAIASISAMRAAPTATIAVGPVMPLLVDITKNVGVDPGDLVTAFGWQSGRSTDLTCLQAGSDHCQRKRKLRHVAILRSLSRAVKDNTRLHVNRGY